MIKNHKRQLGLIELAAQKFGAGEYESALNLCQSILTRQPKEINALNLSGIICDKLDKKKRAIKFFLAALKIDSNNPEICTNLATSYIDVKEDQAAEKYLKRAIYYDSNYVEAIYNLGNIAYRREDFETAKSLYQKAIVFEPHHIRALNNLADILRKQDDIEDAVQCYKKVLSISENYIESLLGLASIEYDRKNYKTSIDLLRRIVPINPDHARASYLLAVSLFNEDKNSAEVVPLLRHSLEIEQKQIDVKNALGAALHISGKYDEALYYLDSALESNPDYAQAHNTRGLVLHEQGDLKAAKQAYTKAIEYEPNFAEALNNCGNLIASAGDPHLALTYFSRAIEIRKESKSALTNFAITSLLLGDFEQAWEPYRFRPSVFENGADTCPLELPDDLSKKRVLLIKDQGIGDELFFLRFLPEFKKRVASLSYNSSHKLIPILARTNFFHDLSIGAPDKSNFDYAFSVGDLPYLCKHQSKNDSPPPFTLTCLSTVEREVAKRLSEFGPPPYIGFSWQAGNLVSDKKVGSYIKNFGAEQIQKTLHEVEGTLVSLQRNPSTADLNFLTTSLNRPILNLDEYNNDLERMLCTLKFLEKYIAVSNTNIHLRAGLGKKSHVLIPYPSEWRWMSDGKQSPWFPDCNIYRQADDGDWSTAIDELIGDLSLC